MTTRTDVTPTYVTSPRVLEVASPSTEMTMQDLVDTARKLEDQFEGMSYAYLLDAFGKQDLGGGVEVGITVSMLDTLLAFQGRTTPAETGTVSTNPGTPILGQDVFTDASADFVGANVARGSLVVNFDDRSIADVVEVVNGTTLRTKTLVNGITNTYGIGDTYHVFNIIQCNATGGNLTALNDIGGTISPILPTAFTQVVLTASSSATSQNAASLEYAAFNGPEGPGVWLDVVKGKSGTGNFATGRPIGTPQDPSNNVPDAVQICIDRGLPLTMYVLGNATFNSGDNLSNFRIIGQNPVRSTFTLDPAATIINAEISDATIGGTLDGNTFIRDCIIGTLAFFDGTLENCKLTGTITLGNSAQADIVGCKSGVAGAATPTINCGGSGQALTLREYSGGIKITNKTGTDDVSIDLTSGQVQVDLTTVTNGALVVRGTGKCVDAADTSDDLLSGTYGSLTLTNETVTGKMVSELWQILGLDPDAPLTVNEDGSYSVGNITITAVTTGTTPNRESVLTRT